MKPPRTERTGRRAALALLAAVLVAGCTPVGEEEAAPPIRPVRTITVSAAPSTPGLSFTGRIEAADHVTLAFRTGGRMIERNVEVGSVVEPGDIVARLEEQNERNAVRSAEAALVAAEAAQVRADNAFGRHQELLSRGVTAQAYFEGVKQARIAADAAVEAARSRLVIARDRLGFTALEADGPGVVTAVGAEPGEVVASGRMIARLARDGGRDGVFDVPAAMLDVFGPDVEVRVSLPGDPAVTATGRVREVSPGADPVTRTFRVRVGLADPPDAMRLGTSVSGTVVAAAGDGFAIPVAAVWGEGADSAVWVVDPADETVAARSVEIARRDPASALVTGGLSEGDIVVTAGVGVLQEGQRVRLSGGRS